MPVNTETWTAPLDFRLRQMRQEGVAWSEIAAALEVNPEAAMTRAGRIGIRPLPMDHVRCDDPAREPLPPGHPAAWDVLTEGTWLEGTRYPMSVGGESEA
jgi:hypothetical protein